MDSLLEDYLWKVSILLSPMPRKRIQDEVRELRSHLNSLADAHRVKGIAREEAESAAIAQLGAPEDVAHGISVVWRRGLLRSAEVHALGVGIVLALLYALQLLEVAAERPYLNVADLRHMPASLIVLTWLNPFGLPALGCVFGYVFSRFKSVSYLAIAVLYVAIASCLNLFGIWRDPFPGQTFNVSLHIFVSSVIPFALAAQLTALRRQQKQQKIPVQ